MPELAAVGIDLGTTYSAVAIMNDHGQAEIVPNAESDRLTPSAVFFDDDTIVVGQIAKDAAATNPDQVVMFVKRQMGSQHWYFSYDQQRHSPSDVSAMIINKLKKDAEQALGRELTHAVITVPAYFDDDRRRATISAASIAGFKGCDLLNEPTAAAIAFGVTNTDRQETVAVYDLGGGTFDVTIMRVEGKNIQILSCDGDHQLGGKDFDDAIMKYAVERFTQEHSFDPTIDPYVAADLRAQAEKVKRELSKRSKTLLVLRAQGKTSQIEVRREQFESMIKSKLDITLTVVRSALAAAQLTPGHIDRVLLIGGSTRVPAVRTTLAQFFGKEPDASVNPDEAVALGAAIMAAKKAVERSFEDVAPPIVEKVGGLHITDVTSHSFGIEASVPNTNKRINSILIPRNSPIPTEVTKEFITTLPGQTAIKVVIYQGEFDDPALCNPVGEFMLSGLPADRPAGRKVRVTIACDTNGVLSVTALDIETGKETRTEVTYKSGASPTQISAKQRWLEQKPVM
ncbi:MAG: Hsp70 family protein [Chloroflexota bacterium]|nr:Hsp70 family protein [Chloroflexota bacterium]